MNRTIRTLALTATTAILLAACGGTEDPAANDAPTAQDAPAQSDGDAPMDDGGDDPGSADESDSWPEVDDGTPPGPFAPEDAAGGTLTGSVYTLGAPEPLPADVANVLSGVGLSEDEAAALRVIPVEIDNSQGTEPEGVYSATVVTDDGDQHEYNSLSGYMFDVMDAYAEAEGSGMGDPPYDAAMEVRDSLPSEVAPTATETTYLVVEGADDPETVTFTYFAINPPMHGEPITMMPID